MEFLKALFGATEDGKPEALTYEQLVEKINAQGDKLQIINLKDGSYVAKEKLDAKIAELKGVQQQLNDANTTIKSYKDMDVDGIKKSVTDWEQRYEKDTAELKEQLAKQEYTHQKDMFFSRIKFSSKAAEVGMKAEFDKQEFQLKDGTFVGAEKWLEDQKTSDAASFVTEERTDGGEDQNTQQMLPQFAAATSSGSGPDQKQQQTVGKFNFNFDGVRKHE